MSFEPLWIDCEGGNAKGHPVDDLVFCAMCGRLFPAADAFNVAVAHKRRDILAELDRGDFG